MSAPEVQINSDATPVAHLKRVLSPWNLILYGVVAVTPSAPATVYGMADRLSHGHAVVTIMASMIAMVLTAISYGRMAALYPSAGSLYTYVGRGVHPFVGFLAGWAMILEYVATPLFCVMYGTLAIIRAVPSLPFPVAAALLAGGITYLNLRGVRSTVRANEVLTFFMFLVLFAYIGLAVRYIFTHQGLGGLFSIKPFYSPGTFDIRAIAGGTSFAAFTFLGFDSVTTLAEDVKNPRRNVMLAAVAVCVFTGVFGGLMVYLAQLAWPDYTTFTNIETAFIEVTGRVGGIALFRAMAILLVIANIGAGMTNQVAAARLMFGMGRDNMIPRRFFSYLNPKTNAPSRNIWLIGALAYFGALAMSYELTAEIINFGAFLGFIAVNLAVLGQFGIRRIEGYQRRFFADFLLPAAGSVFCTVIFIGLGRLAMIAGGVWLVIGLVVLVKHTSGFRQRLMLPDPATYQ